MQKSLNLTNRIKKISKRGQNCTFGQLNEIEMLCYNIAIVMS